MPVLFIGTFFNTFLVNPLTNLFVLLTTLTGNAGFGVILLTIIIRLATYPLQRRQMQTTRMMSALQPRIADIQKKYKDPKRRSEEQMKLYKEAGFNPVGCMSGMIVQFPILIALYATFNLAVGESPESLLKLAERLYPWDYLQSGMPLPAHFLWLNLGRPDPFVIPILVAITTYLLQKMTMMPAMTEQQRAQNSMMNLMMPLIFGWITLSLPSGLGLYYVLSNLIGVAMQYIYVGRGPINWRAFVGLSQDPVLPRAALQRAEHEAAINKIARGSTADESDDAGEDPVEMTKKALSAPKRRRYSNGKRRGRR